MSFDTKTNSNYKSTSPNLRIESRRHWLSAARTRRICSKQDRHHRFPDDERSQKISELIKISLFSVKIRQQKDINYTIMSLAQTLATPASIKMKLDQQTNANNQTQLTYEGAGTRSLRRRRRSPVVVCRGQQQQLDELGEQRRSKGESRKPEGLLDQKPPTTDPRSVERDEFERTGRNRAAYESKPLDRILIPPLESNQLMRTREVGFPSSSLPPRSIDGSDLRNNASRKSGIRIFFNPDLVFVVSFSGRSPTAALKSDRRPRRFLQPSRT